MKKNKSFIYLATVALMFTGGCSLTEENLSGVSTAEEWTTVAGFEKKVNECYFDMIRVIYGQAEDTYVMATEAGTDIWQDPNNNSGSGWGQITSYSGFGASTGMLLEGFSGFYGTLNACNAVLYYADKVEGLQEARKQALVAEARFIRAHALFNIVEQWGGKYLPLEPTSSPVSSPACSSINDFYKILLDDLKYAKTYLPVSQEIRGRVTRAAAYHLYAKACLTYATYTDGLCGATPLSEAESKAYLLEAREAANYLIADAESSATLGVKLYKDIEDVFDEDNNKTNEEALFVVCHSTIQAYNPRGNYYNRVWKHFTAYKKDNTGIYSDGLTTSMATTVNGYEVPKLPSGNCYLAPSKAFLDLYVEKDGRYKAFFKDTYYCNVANNEAKNGYTWTESDATRYGVSKTRVKNSTYDVTLGDTIIYLSKKPYTKEQKEALNYAVYNIDDNYADPSEPGKFFPSLKKADCPGLIPASVTNPGKPYTAADCIIYRLGETYLLSAEIEWRLGEKGSAVKRLNTIRNRACIGHDNSLDIEEDDVTVDFLLDEYAREMCGEWNRWTTLKRFRALGERIKKCNPQIKTFNEKVHYLRPVPNQELLLIDNAAEYQNPGY